MITFFKRLNLFILLFIIVFTFGLINFKNSIPQEKKLKEVADAVVVLTGDRGKRIEKGYELIDNTKFNKLFISGVSGSMKVLQKILDFDEQKVECCIEVGYKSKNTLQNAIETNFWASKNNFKSIILITTDLHMQRALFLFHQITDLNIIPYAIEYKNTSIPLEKLVIEYAKYIISRIVFIKKYED